MTRVTIELHVLRRMDLAKNWLVYGYSFVGSSQVVESNDLVALEAAHELMRCVAIGTQKMGTIGTASHRVLHGLARGTKHAGVLDGRHVQDVGDDVVAG